MRLFGRYEPSGKLQYPVGEGGCIEGLVILFRKVFGFFDKLQGTKKTNALNKLKQMWLDVIQKNKMELIEDAKEYPNLITDVDAWWKRKITFFLEAVPVMLQMLSEHRDENAVIILKQAKIATSEYMESEKFQLRMRVFNRRIFCEILTSNLFCTSRKKNKIYFAR